MPAPQHRFFELIRPGTRFDFVGRQHRWFRLAVAATTLSLLMLIVNALLPGRHSALNWSVDFRGGSEVVVDFARPVPPKDVRGALEAGGYEGVEVVALGATAGALQAERFQIRFGSISPLAKQDADRLRAVLESHRRTGLTSFDWSEAGDRISLKFDQPVEAPQVATIFQQGGITPVSIQPVVMQKTSAARSFDVTLVSLDKEIQARLEARLGPGSVKTIPSASSVGAKAGAQLRTDALKALLGAVMLIMIYIAFRFDVRYAPATMVALLHDAIIMIGVLAATFRDVSLTTVAALLTIVGFSMNDKVVVFDRIRELAARNRGGDFRQTVNQALNQTLSRTILTNSTVFFVTLAMNLFGVGVIREFAFAMNVGIIVATFSTIFVATPVVIWLNDRFLLSQRKGRSRSARGAAAGSEPLVEP